MSLHRLLAPLSLILLMTACQNTPPAPTAPEKPAQTAPGATTSGGRGGQIIKVTTLAASGPGSLRAALESSGPRVIVFEVGGIIDLDRQDLILRQPFVTIAGQTAPSPGITLIRGGMKIRTNDVIMQHLRFRMGDAGLPKKNGYEVDVSIEGKGAFNVLVDHCSVAWGTDENLSISGPRHDGPSGTAHRVTLSNNIVAEGLVNSTHSKGAHSMGSLVHDDVRDVLIRGNLYTHNADRNPWFKGGSTGALINNFIYNPGKWAVRLGYNPKEWEKRTPPPAPKLAIIGNLLQHGADTPASLAMIGSNSPDLQGDAYMRDNLAFLKTGAPALLVSGDVSTLSENPFPVEGKILPATQLREQLLPRVGARPADRDSVDLRLIAEIGNGTGRQIDSQNDVGGYPSASPTHRTLTVPASDIDAWLDSFSRQVEGN